MGTLSGVPFFVLTFFVRKAEHTEGNFRLNIYGTVKMHKVIKN